MVLIEPFRKKRRVSTIAQCEKLLPTSKRTAMSPRARHSLISSSSTSSSRESEVISSDCITPSSSSRDTSSRMVFSEQPSHDSQRDVRSRIFDMEPTIGSTSMAFVQSESTYEEITEEPDGFESQSEWEYSSLPSGVLNVDQLVHDP